MRLLAWPPGFVGYAAFVLDMTRVALIDLTAWSLERGIAARLVQATVLAAPTWSDIIAFFALLACGFPVPVQTHSSRKHRT